MTPEIPNDRPSPGGRAEFTRAELSYLFQERRLGRLATCDTAGQPHVVPVGWSYNRDLGTIDVGGRDLAATQKYRNVEANPRVAFVVDDVLPPFQPRCVMVRGHATLTSSEGEHGTVAVIRIMPDKIVSWGLGDQ